MKQRFAAPRGRGPRSHGPPRGVAPRQRARRHRHIERNREIRRLRRRQTGRDIRRRIRDKRVTAFIDASRVAYVGRNPCVLPLSRKWSENVRVALTGCYDVRKGLIRRICMRGVLIDERPPRRRRVGVGCAGGLSVVPECNDEHVAHRRSSRPRYRDRRGGPRRAAAPLRDARRCGALQMPCADRRKSAARSGAAARRNHGRDNGEY